MPGTTAHQRKTLRNAIDVILKEHPKGLAFEDLCAIFGKTSPSTITGILRTDPRWSSYKPKPVRQVRTIEVGGEEILLPQPPAKKVRTIWFRLRR